MRGVALEAQLPPHPRYKRGWTLCVERAPDDLLRLPEVRTSQEFLEFIERTRAQLADGSSLQLQAWAEKFLEEADYINDLRRSEKNIETADNRVRNLKDLMADLDSDPALPPAERLQTFLEVVTLDSDREDDKEKTGDAVTLITMHSCKGLEFPHVQVVGLEDGLLPHTRSKTEGTLDEERRLFYVAITRAKLTQHRRKLIRK